MTSVNETPANGDGLFTAVVSSFADEDGLPFAEILDAKTIERAFDLEDGLFAQDDIFATDVTLWAFLAQVLRDGKGASCTAAVADIATYMIQTGRKPPAGDTGDYCRARAKLSLPVLRNLGVGLAGELERNADEEWLWNGLHVKLVDGFTITMPDTEKNQEEFPQPSTQAEGVGFPMARCCTVVSAATACVCDIAMGPYQGKETGETALLREILDAFDEGDVAVLDRLYGSYMMLAMLQLRGIHACTRLHHGRINDPELVRRLGKNDDLIVWNRPVRPEWMSEALYKQIPEELLLRQVRCDLTGTNCRTEQVTVITTLTDSEAYTADDIAKLYSLRWNVELDIREIKRTLGLDHMRCKSPHMVRRELRACSKRYRGDQRLAEE